MDIFRIAHERFPHPYVVIDGQERLLDFNTAAGEKFGLIEKYKEKHVSEIERNLNIKSSSGNIFKPLLETLKMKREYKNYKLRIINLKGQDELLFASTFLVNTGSKIIGAYAFYYKSILHLKNPPEKIESKFCLNSLEQAGIINCLTKIIALKDPYTLRHCEQVAHYASLIAKKWGLNEDKIHTIYLAGLLHDIGKIGIPESILNKPGKLTEKEFKNIKMHPVIAVDILKYISGMDSLLPIIYHHHERWDGNGYPRGLKGTEIPLESRILAVADAFEAMTSDRSYRKKYTLNKALQEIIKNRGTQFDPDVVDVFLKVVRETPDHILIKQNL